MSEILPPAAAAAAPSCIGWLAKITTSRNALRCTSLSATCNCFSWSVSSSLPLWTPGKLQCASFASSLDPQPRSTKVAGFYSASAPSRCTTTPEWYQDTDYSSVASPSSNPKSPCKPPAITKSVSQVCLRSKIAQTSRSATQKPVQNARS